MIFMYTEERELDGKWCEENFIDCLSTRWNNVENRWKKIIVIHEKIIVLIKRGSARRPTKLAAAKFLIFDLTISNDRPSLEKFIFKISALSDLSSKNAEAYKWHYSWHLVKKNSFLGCPDYFAFFSAFARRFEFGDVSKDAEKFSLQNWLIQEFLQ